MKNAVLAGGAGGVFLIGIAVGVALRGEPATPNQPSAGWQAVAQESGRTTAAASEQRPDLVAKAPEGAQAAEDDEPAGPARRPARADSIYRGPNAVAPPPPPPPSATALAEGEQVKRELDKRGKRGGGRVTTLVYPKDPAEAKALENKRLARWERRLQYGMKVKINGLRTKVGLSANQEARLQDILQAELNERKKLVSLHMNKQLSNTTFDEKVKANRDQAKAKVKALLTERQYATYTQLKPREQVLRDDVK